MQTMTGQPEDLLLDVRGLRTFFDTHGPTIRAVDGVDLSLRPGEAVGLVGESGCGNSVLARSLLRLVFPPGRIVEGQIRFRGEDLLTKTQAQMRRLRGREIAIVLQDPMTTLNPSLIIGRQIAEALGVHGLVRGRRELHRRTVELMDAVRIQAPEERYGHYPHEFSGGMRQRAVIAAALACKPSLLICDEPTTALDVTIQAQILELLDQVRQRNHMAILFISHDAAVVGRLCDRVAVMYAGRILELGPTRELLTAPLHPYTQGLLQCVPRIGIRAEPRPIAGEAPDPAHLPPGCKFHPRCPRAQPRCSRAEPPLYRAGLHRLSRCILQEGNPAS